MDKALHISLFSCVFISVLIYLIVVKMQITQNKNTVSGLYNNVTHAGDKDLDGAEPTFSLDKVIDQKKKKYSELIKNGIFWSDFAESFVPAGSSVENYYGILSYLRSQDVKGLTLANGTDCGKRGNGIAVLRDGTRICVRHRLSEFQIQADVLAFHLSRMLKMDNVPETFLTKISDSTSLWKQLKISSLPWNKNETVGMIKWIPNARGKCLLSPIVKEAYGIRAPITQAVIRSSEHAGDSASIAHLIQLGTSIVFDYLVCHRDRLRKWQHFGKYRFGQIWIHNTVQSPNGKVWLIDNESAFACQSGHNNVTIEVMKFHNKMLKTMCVFQSSVVTALKVLSKQTSAFTSLLSYSKSFEPLLNTKHLHARYRSGKMALAFDGRLAKIMEWIRTCKEKYT